MTKPTMKITRKRPTLDECEGKENSASVSNGLKTGPLDYLIDIPIGDWSDDGHGKQKVFRVTSNKPLKALVNALKAAEKRLPLCSPLKLFKSYEEHFLTEEGYYAAFDAGYDLLHGFNEPEERARRLKDCKGETWADILLCPQIEPEEFVLFLFWYLQQGDDELKFNMAGNVPRLFGYGGITDQAGYGLFL